MSDALITPTRIVTPLLLLYHFLHLRRVTSPSLSRTQIAEPLMHLELVLQMIVSLHCILIVVLRAYVSGVLKVGPKAIVVPTRFSLMPCKN